MAKSGKKQGPETNLSAGLSAGLSADTSSGKKPARVATADQALGRAANSALAMRLATAREALGMEATELSLLIGGGTGRHPAH